MASYTIPEEIIGVPLFVPDDYDQFTIEAGGMPNGDDCLVVHGDISTDYMAFQNAPTTVPDMFRDAVVGTNRAMSVWLKIPSGASTGQLLASQALAGTLSTGIFSLYNDATADVRFSQGKTGGSPGFTYSRRVYQALGIRDNNWHLLVVNIRDQSNTGLSGDDGAFIDLSTTGGLQTNGTSGSGADGAGTTNKLVIGSYSASLPAAAMEWRIGKLAFHNQWLNQTERAILYNAMTT